ncbi:methyl-accepting chemotaxis protein [Vibrio intestinalis]|uniref:methyl-accepting chemotaxis protein n=1 Tax=Vibrio intestinalis TaxID=2933291 RepID=UPI0021A75B39|nr:methyl-accepting chemotaxis protein [Vibrio intestinalis]
MKFKDISIKKKVSAVFVLIALAVVILMAFISNQVTQVRDAMNVFATTTVPSVLQVKNMQISIEEIRRDQYALAANPNDKLVPIWHENIATFVNEINTSLDTYRQGLWDERDRIAFAELEKRWQVYHHQINLFTELMQHGDIAEANRVTVEGYDEYQAAFSAMTGLEEINQIYISEDNEVAHQRVEHTFIVGAIGSLAVISFMLVVATLLIKQICDPLDLVIALAQRISRGDLTGRLARDKIGNDELGDLADACQTMQNGLNQMVEEIASASTQLATSIEEVSAVSAQTEQGMASQQHELEMVSTAMTQLQSTVNEVANNTEEASSAATEANTSTAQGAGSITLGVQQIEKAKDVIEDAGSMVAQLEKDSSDISMVVDVIQGIAEQTNLLALNAAIEAARAGEQGRGFAVVADEVRTLAGRTQSSTEEIVTIIGQLQDRAKRAVEATNQSCEIINRCNEQAIETGETMRGINISIENIANMNIQIASACSEQSSVSEELQRNVDNIQHSSTEVAAGATQTAQACAELSQLASNMQVIIHRFKVA